MFEPPCILTSSLPDKIFWLGYTAAALQGISGGWIVISVCKRVFVSLAQMGLLCDLIHTRAEY
jgi:hypothetical protein